MTPEAALAKVLRETRVAAGLSQEQLADRLGCSRGYVSYLETGAYNPTVSFLFRLSGAIGVPARDLVAQAEVMADEPSARTTRPRSRNFRSSTDAGPGDRPGEADL